jgi:hypothetical protein
MWRVFARMHAAESESGAGPHVCMLSDSALSQKVARVRAYAGCQILL